MSRRTPSSDLVRSRFLILLLVSLIVAAGGWRPAEAQSRPLDAPRANGTVAERFDGFAMVRDAGAPGAVRSLVESTNAERRALYERVAKEQATTAAAVGRIYAKQIFDAAPTGTYFLTEDNRWIRK